MITTITLWLLVSVGNGGGSPSYSQPTVVVERFASGADCARVSKIIQDQRSVSSPLLICIQAQVARP